MNVTRSINANAKPAAPSSRAERERRQQAYERRRQAHRHEVSARCDTLEAIRSQLLDMGYSRRDVLEALKRSSTLDACTAWLRTTGREANVDDAVQSLARQHRHGFSKWTKGA